MKRVVIPLLIALVLVFGFVTQGFAQGQTPDCHYDPATNEIVCEMGGGGGRNGGGGNNGGSGGAQTCTPGEIVETQVSLPAAIVDGSWEMGPNEAGTCAVFLVAADSCTGEVQYISEPLTPPGECPSASVNPPNPCEILVVTPTGAYCETRWEWNLVARVRFPNIRLDARPYPASLVRWDTAIRLGNLPPNSGTGRLAYIPWGGGSQDDPAPGDWRDVRLTLTLRPASSFADVYLPNIGILKLPLVGGNGAPYIFHWEVPSHPAAGGGPLAGKVGQLEELPADFPLFEGWARSPYRLFWELGYYQWEDRCVGGPGESGELNCRRVNGYYTGHREWGWYRHSQGGEIPPTAVRGLPPALMADLNGDGVPEAYWDRQVEIWRMNEANSIFDPTWEHSYAWGDVFYWGVREGQGQIGWPGQP